MPYTGLKNMSELSSENKTDSNMKLKNLTITDVIRDPRIILTLWDHFNHSIKDITSYEDLTPEEKRIIPQHTFELITEKEPANTRPSYRKVEQILTKKRILRSQSIVRNSPREEPLKFYNSIGPRREIHVIAFDLRNRTATIQNPDGSTRDIKLKALILKPEE